MFVIVGLGNPGKQYANTRHNLGFITIDRFAERHGISVSKIKFKSLIGEADISGKKVLLVKPQTYMNLSGEAVREVVRFYKVAASDLVVVYDDVDIPEGTIRIRSAGSAGTHNGMRSVVCQLATDRFPRIRIGIGREDRGELVNHVIGGVTKDEVPILEEQIDIAADALECFIERGIDIAMNRYNPVRSPDKTGNQ